MHYQFCPAHRDWHIPCDCCGDGWDDGLNDPQANEPSPCGAYKNRRAWLEAAHKHERKAMIAELEASGYYINHDDEGRPI